MYPDDSIQNYVEPWWIEDDSRKVERGRLLIAFLPHVHQIPYTLIPEGRKLPTDHTSGFFRMEALQIKKPPKLSVLPVAAMPAYDNEIYLVYRAKRRPAIVISEGGDFVQSSMRTGGAKWQTSPTLIIAPAYGTTQSGKRGGWNQELVMRIRHCEYPQYIWDNLPISADSEESIIRLDHIQPIGNHPAAFEITKYKLDEEALKVVDDWMSWLFTGLIDEDGILHDIRFDLRNLE